MKYFKDTNTGEVFAYEADGSQDEFIPVHLVAMTPSEVQEHLTPPLTFEQAKSRIIQDVQNLMDSEARLYGYDDIKSAVTYAEEPAVLKFQDEGRGFRAWRSLVWAKCYEILQDFQTGVISEVTTEDVFDELPVLQITYRT